MKKVISTIICIFLALLMALSIFMILRHYSEEKKAADAYSDMLDFVVTEGADETESTEPAETEGTESVTTPETEPAQEEQCITIDFDQLLAQYPNAVGWLYCEGTPINYPVMQSDDNDYYLRRLPDGTYNTAGSLFADYRCGKIGETNNYIIYGHNMDNGSMFAELLKYRTQDYYDKHKEMLIHTPDKKYKLEIFSGYVASVEDFCYTAIGEYIDMGSLISYAKSCSYFVSDTEVSSDDKIVLLSTCAYDFKNARFVVFGKLTEIIE